ncbi:MAG: TRAP transporter large permease [Salinicola sp.]|nr:TRAP transporter large permease [Salinicola sp.]
MFSLVSGGTSISALFIAGYIPGMLMGLTVMIVAGIIARKRGYRSSVRSTPGEALQIVLRALPALGMIVVIIGGIVIGVFTATEAAAVAVLYALILSLAYRMTTPREYLHIFCRSAILTASILFLIASSGVMSYVMTIAGIPDMIADTILQFDNLIVVFLIMNLCLLVIGFFIDLTPAVLIFTPIFLPIAQQMGVDPVQFGIMLIFNLGVGSMTPPVGSVLFVGCSIAGLRIDQVVKPILPFFFALVIALLMVTYIPWLSLGLPHLFGLM